MPYIRQIAQIPTSPHTLLSFFRENNTFLQLLGTSFITSRHQTFCDYKAPKWGILNLIKFADWFLRLWHCEMLGRDFLMQPLPLPPPMVWSQFMVLTLSVLLRPQQTCQLCVLSIFRPNFSPISEPWNLSIDKFYEVQKCRLSFENCVIFGRAMRYAPVGLGQWLHSYLRGKSAPSLSANRSVCLCPKSH